MHHTSSSPSPSRRHELSPSNGSPSPSRKRLSPSPSRRQQSSPLPSGGLTFPQIKGARGGKQKPTVNSKLASMMFRQGGPLLIPQDLRTHVHELGSLKDGVRRYLEKKAYSSKAKSTDIEDIMADLETYSAFFADLVRQASVHSVELGRVQVMIWNDFVGLFQRLIKLQDETESKVVELDQQQQLTEQKEALQNNSELKQQQYAYEEKLRIQSDVMLQKDRKLFMQEQTNIHLEQENFHLRELLAAHEFEMSNQKRDKGLNKMNGHLGGLIEDVESETKKQHNVVMDMKRLVAQVRLAQNVGSAVECEEIETQYDDDKFFFKEGLFGTLEESPEEARRVMKTRIIEERQRQKEAALAAGEEWIEDGEDDFDFSMLDSEGEGEGAGGQDDDDATNRGKRKRRSKAKEKEDTRGWDEIWVSHKPKPNGPCWTRKSIEKFIAQIYFDKIQVDMIDDRDNKPRMSMVDFCYENILNKYGLKTLARKNMLVIMNSVHHWMDKSPRVKMFGQFCGVAAAGPKRGLDVLNFYLFSVNYTHGKPKHHADEVGLGLNALSLEADQAFLDIKQAEQAASWLHSECFKGGRDVLVQLSTEYRGILVDKEGSRKVQFDQFMELVTIKWEQELEHSKKTLESMFISADVDNDGILTFDEFSALVWSIKPGITQRQMTKMYEEAQAHSASDSLTPDDFVKVASDYGLLSHMMKSREFATLQQNDDFSYLEILWEEVKERVARELQALEESSCDPELLTQLSAGKTKFEALLKEKANLSASWLCYRTLESGIRRALLRYMDGFIDEVLNSDNSAELLSPRSDV